MNTQKRDLMIRLNQVEESIEHCKGVVFILQEVRKDLKRQILNGNEQPAAIPPLRRLRD